MTTGLLHGSWPLGWRWADRWAQWEHHAPLCPAQGQSSLAPADGGALRCRRSAKVSLHGPLTSAEGRPTGPGKDARVPWIYAEI